jgi:hypothetical protein
MRSRTGQGLSLSFDIDGTDAQAANEQLAQAIGEGYARTEGADAGQWRLSATISEAQFLDLVSNIARNTASARTARAWLLTRADRGGDLQERVAMTPSADACRVLLAGFVSDLGMKGAGYIRRIVGDLSWNVRLVGSNTFTGAEGRRAVRAELADIAGRHRSDPEGAVRALRRLYVRERRRVDRIEREAAELPESLRDQEAIAQQQVIEQIREALHSARVAASAASQQGDVDDEVTGAIEAEADLSQLGSGYGAIESSVEDHELRTSAVEAARAHRHSARSALDSDIRRAEAAGRAANRIRGEIRRERAIHDRGRAGRSGPREFLSSVFVGESSTYDRIDRLYREAEDARQESNRLIDIATSTRDAISAGDVSASAAAMVDNARRAAWRAHDRAREARNLWLSLRANYRGLRNRHPDTDPFPRVPFGGG